MMLEPLEELRVLDLFAGSGALGIEALSRGAQHVDFVEWRATARKALFANLTTLELSGRARVWPLQLPRGFNRIRNALRLADLVLVDPPYGGEEARATLRILGEEECLKPGTRVIVEHHAKDLLPERAGRLERIHERRYGETTVTFYRALGFTGPA